MGGAADDIGDGVNGIAFHTDEDDIGLAGVFLGGEGGEGQGMLAFQVRLQVQSLPADGFEVLAPGDAGHVLACQGQKTGDAASHTAGSYYEIVHCFTR